MNDCPNNRPPYDEDHPPMADAAVPSAGGKEDLPDSKAEVRYTSVNRQIFRLITSTVILLAILAALTVILFSTGEKHDDVVVSLFSENLLPVAVEKELPSGETVLRWGYINKSGTLAIRPEYEMAREFTDIGLAPVKKDGRWGYIGKDGEIKIDIFYEDARSFGDHDYAAVKLNGSWGFINKKGRLVINPQFDEVSSFSDGLARVSIGGKFGYINTKGVYVIPPSFKFAGDFKNSHAPVFDLDKWGMIDGNGDYSVNPQFDFMMPFSKNGLALVRKDKLYGYINREGVYYIFPEFDYAESFTDNGLALVKKGDGYGYINKNGKFEISPVYEEASSFSKNGLAAVYFKESGKWGYINKNGETVIEPRFKQADTFHNGYAKVEIEENQFAFIDSDGDVVYMAEEGERLMSPFFEDGFAIVARLDETTGKYSCFIINKKGKISKEHWAAVYPYLGITANLGN